MNFLNQHIYSEILKGLNGVNTDNQLFLGYYTPKILVECGMPNLPLMTNSSHLKENIFYKYCVCPQLFIFSYALNNGTISSFQTITFTVFAFSTEKSSGMLISFIPASKSLYIKLTQTNSSSL